MAIKPFDIMNLGKAGLIDPAQAGYRDSLEIIKDESFRIQKSFVKIGWYLKHIRDNKLYKEDGYASIYECAADQFGYSQSTVSRFINICEKFSKNHDSPEIDGKYTGFDKSQMIEMLPMEPELLEKVTPDMTVKQIREIKSADKEKNDTSIPADDDIPGQTSIEKDFPEYMPGNQSVEQKISESHPVKECEADNSSIEILALQEEDCVVDGEYREVEEQKSVDETITMSQDVESIRPNMKMKETAAEWLNNYKSWGLWYHDEHIDVNYYKFDFSDGSRLIVSEYPQRVSFYDGELADEHYYHLLERNKKGYGKVVYDEKYRYNSDGKAYIVDFLENLQKKR